MWEAIFRFLFKYPPVAYSRGRLTLASDWAGWVLVVVVLLAAVAIGVYLWKVQPRLSPRRRLIVGSLQWLTLAVLLLLLWRPSLVVSMLVPQRNALAILVDDSASMAMPDGGVRRIEEVRKVLDDSGPLLRELREKFQVRLYRFSGGVNRLAAAGDLEAAGTASHIEESLSELYSELRHLPLAGIVVVSDGAQNGSVTSREGLEELRARQIPVYSLGVGRESFDRDLQIDD
ncbi:MAG: VWA domain-containing protein, partial [Acidobacteria bacterium]|nr:VWA domain-containing protein [Acidobacteriota bacterium]